MNVVFGVTGQYTGSPSTPCQNCSAGLYGYPGYHTGSSFCFFCTAGKYSLAGAGACTNCPAGQSSSILDPTHCSNCSAGMRSSKGELPLVRDRGVTPYIYPTDWVLRLLLSRFPLQVNTRQRVVPAQRARLASTVPCLDRARAKPARPGSTEAAPPAARSARTR